MKKNTNIKRVTVIAFMAIISVGCDSGLQSELKSDGVIIEKSLSLTQAKLDSLGACTFDRDCRNDEVCSVLDLKDGPVTKCIKPINICDEATCKAGSCIALDLPVSSNEPGTKVTCVDGGDFTNGIPGSAPGNSGSGATGPTYELGVKELKNLVSTAASFSFEAKLASSGELIRVVVNQSNPSQCWSEALRANDGKLKLSLFGTWKSVKVPGFSGNTYQFIRAEYCYAGDFINPMPEI